MGLDSVELIISLEKEFGITIEDHEWEKISTVEEISNKFYEKLIIESNDKCLSQIIFYRVRKSLQNLNLAENLITPKTKISNLFITENLREKWNQLETELELKLPELVSLDFNNKLDSHVKVFGIKTIRRDLPITKGTIGQLVDWIISLNFSTIIDLKNITSKYEIQRIVTGIISDRIGLPINEIELKHSITYDLGID